MPVLISGGAIGPKNGRRYFLLSMGAVYCVLGFSCGSRFNSHASATWFFLRWLAPQYPEIKRRLPNEIAKYRNAAVRSGQHPRTPELIANPMVGLNTFLHFAASVGALSRHDAWLLRRQVWSVLLTSAAAQTIGQAAEEPARRFLDLVVASISRGDACVDEIDNPSHENKGRLIGWMNGDGLVLLEPDSAYAAANQLANQQGQSLPVTPKTLAKRLAERGFLVQQGSDHIAVLRTVGGRRRRVWAIRAEAFQLTDMELMPLS